MQSLVDKSLVRRWESGRFGMLETIREFADEQLDEDERDALLRRLLAYLLQLFEGAHLGPHGTGLPQMELAQQERPNVDVAIAWATATAEADLGLRLLELLELYWSTNDPVGARERLDALLAVAGELGPAVHAKALRLRGGTFDMSSQVDLAQAEYERALALLPPSGYERERAHLSLRLANSIARQGESERARALATETLPLVRGTGNRRDEAFALSILSRLAFSARGAAEGARLAHEAAAIATAAGFAWWQGVTLLGAAEELLRLGEPEAALKDFREGLRTLATVRDLVNIPIALAAGAALAASLDDAVRAGTLWGALEAEAERDPRPTTAENIDFYEPYLESVRGEEFEQARTHGRTLSLDDAVAYALGP
jgi:tetratricopeptide (TPR) repeat protein